MIGSRRSRGSRRSQGEVDAAGGGRRSRGAVDAAGGGRRSQGKVDAAGEDDAAVGRSPQLTFNCPKWGENRSVWDEKYTSKKLSTRSIAWYLPNSKTHARYIEKEAKTSKWHFSKNQGKRPEILANRQSIRSDLGTFGLIPRKVAGRCCSLICQEKTLDHPTEFRLKNGNADA